MRWPSIVCTSLTVYLELNKFFREKLGNTSFEVVGGLPKLKMLEGLNMEHIMLSLIS